MTTKLHRQPIFSNVRVVAGALAADAATINDSNYPLTSAIELSATSDKLAAYWYAGGGTVLPFDYVDLQLLERDTKYSAAGRWVEGEIRSGVRQNDVVFFTPRSTQCFLRVFAVSCASGTGLVIRAASAITG